MEGADQYALTFQLTLRNHARSQTGFELVSVDRGLDAAREAREGHG
jgi:hypothetical protein